MSLSLLLQQCPACLVRLTCIVFVMGGRWPYSWCFVGCCCQELSLKKLICHKTQPKKYVSMKSPNFVLLSIAFGSLKVF